VSTYTLRHANPAKTRCDAVVVGVVQSGKGLVVAPGGEDVAKEYGRAFRPLLASLGVTGKLGEVTKVPTGKRLPSPLEATVGKAAFQPLDGGTDPLLNKWSDVMTRSKATIKLRQKVKGKATGTYRKLVLVTLSTETP